jgi:RNA recognition motif-containing protein
MATVLYVENVPSDITREALEVVFAQFGEVRSVRIKNDLRTILTDHPAVYGVVEMELEIDAYRAINCFSGATFGNRKILVKEAYPLFEKTKNVFEHFRDSYALTGFKPLAAFNRWKD